MSAHEKGDCPGCTHPDPRTMTDDQLKRVPGRINDQIGSTPGRVMICGYCGCVYKINIPPVVFGFLDNPLKGKGWVAGANEIRSSAATWIIATSKDLKRS